MSTRTDHEDHGAAQPAPKDIDECRWSLDETAAVAWKRRLPRRDGVKFECIILEAFCAAAIPLRCVVDRQFPLMLDESPMEKNIASFGYFLD
ncbi:hypothetical protein KAR48_08065 [bacterium]|nr:hypothetical protein [bacterium]